MGRFRESGATRMLDRLNRYSHRIGYLDDSSQCERDSIYPDEVGAVLDGDGHGSIGPSQRPSCLLT
jgi:hypothetical protein